VNVLHVVQKDGFIVIEPREIFGSPVNRYREIVVDDPDHVYGPPVYQGPAFKAAKYLVPGAYWYVWADDDDEPYSD
jgi:hypothetical protein